MIDSLQLKFFFKLNLVKHHARRAKHPVESNSQTMGHTIGGASNLCGTLCSSGNYGVTHSL